MAAEPGTIPIIDHPACTGNPSRETQTYPCQQHVAPAEAHLDIPPSQGDVLHPLFPKNFTKHLLPQPGSSCIFRGRGSGECDSSRRTATPQLACSKQRMARLDDEPLFLLKLPQAGTHHNMKTHVIITSIGPFRASITVFRSPQLNMGQPVLRSSVNGRPWVSCFHMCRVPHCIA